MNSELFLGYKNRQRGGFFSLGLFNEEDQKTKFDNTSRIWFWSDLSDGHFDSLSGLKHWTKSKVVNLISDPNLFKCIMDPGVMRMLNHAKSKYSVFNFLKHPDLDSFKRTGKVSFVKCKKWLIFHEPLVQWSRSVVNINKLSDNGTLRLLYNAHEITKIMKTLAK